MKYTWAARSDTGRVRDHNEDTTLPAAGTAGSGDQLVAAVADGMGGAAGGEIASTTAIATIAAVPGEAAIRIQAANLAVVEAAARRPRLKGMGTTVTLALFHPDGRLQIGHVGDSRAYLLRAGSLSQISTDHSFVNEMLTAGRMTEAEAEVHPYRSVVTRAVGLEPGLDVDVENLMLAIGDRILLCSDGVTSMLEDAEIHATLTTEADPERAADSLVGAANAAGGIDNISVVIVDAG